MESINKIYQQHFKTMVKNIVHLDGISNKVYLVEDKNNKKTILKMHVPSSGEINLLKPYEDDLYQFAKNSKLGKKNYF